MVNCDCSEVQFWISSTMEREDQKSYSVMPSAAQKGWKEEMGERDASWCF